MKLVKKYSSVFLKSIAIVMLAALTFASCKKDKDDTVVPPVPPVVGKWAVVLNTNGAPVASLNLVIKQNGTLEAQNIAGEKKGDGTWQLGGSAGVTFSCSYITNSATPQKYNLFGTLETQAKMTGSWGTGNSHYNGGFFSLSKQ